MNTFTLIDDTLFHYYDFEYERNMPKNEYHDRWQSRLRTGGRLNL
jgi:hypothetical protein